MPDIKLAHIVNPVAVGKRSDLYVAQPITFESMKNARDYSASLVEVSLYSAQYEEDRFIVPKWLEKTRDLDRSILDISRNSGVRKLPLLKDILLRLYEASNATFFIYTNVDIGLKRNFYSAVYNFIRKGFDGFSITRRTISSRFTRVEDLPLIYLETGRSHSGSDCFVFRRNFFPDFELGNVCLGVPPIGRVLLCNCIGRANKFGFFKNENLTFHLGDAQSWKKIDGPPDPAHVVSLKSGIRTLKSLGETYDNKRGEIIQNHLKRLLLKYRRLLKSKMNASKIAIRRNLEMAG